MSTTNFYDIPDFYREKLNVRFQETEQEEAEATVEDVSVENEKITETDSEYVMEGQEIIEEQENLKNDLFEYEEVEAEEVMAQARCHGRNCSHKEPSCPNGNCHRPWRPPYPQYPFHPCPMGSFCRRNENMMPPVPFFRAHPGSLFFQEEMEDIRDMEKIQQLYPTTAMMIKNIVSEQADRMDYDGSMMFDETPDRVMIERIVNEIYDRLMRDNEEEKKNRGNTCELCDNAGNEALVKELITVLLFQEMYRRRCRNRQCYRWW